MHTYIYTSICTYTHTHIIYVYIYIYYGNFVNKKKLKLATKVEGEPMAPFSLATTLRCKGGCYSLPWNTPLTLNYTL